MSEYKLEYKSEVNVSPTGHTEVSLKEIRESGAFVSDELTGHLEFCSQEEAFKFFSSIIEKVLQDDPQDYSSGQKRFIDTLIRYLLDDPRSLSDKEYREEVIKFLEDNLNLMETKTKRDRLYALGFQHALGQLIALTKKD